MHSGIAARWTAPAGRRRLIDRLFTYAATRASLAAGRPVAFIVATATIAAWLLTGPLFNWSDTWQLVVNTATTIITFLMVFLIQNSQNRDAAALQAKLDEVIRVLANARNEFIGIEHLTDNEIEGIRAELEEEVRAAGTGHRSFQTVERLLSRH